MLKQNDDGDWVIEDAKDLDEVVAAIEERRQSVEEIEERMEEEYDYLTMQQEITSLTEALTSAMNRFDVAHLFRDTYKVTLVKRSKTTWDAEKLKKIVPKGMWLKITRQFIDPEKIDDLVRGGQLDIKKLEPAFVSKPEKPHVRFYPYKEGQDKDAAIDEEAALRAAMSQETVAASGSKRKKGR